MNGNLQQWRWHDAIQFNWTAFLWLLIGSYLIVLIALVIRVLLCSRSTANIKMTEDPAVETEKDCCVSAGSSKVLRYKPARKA